MRRKNRKLTIADVYDIDNIRLAVKNSRKGKNKNYGVRTFDKHLEENIQKIHDSLKDRTYHITPPVLEKRFCVNKWRVLAKVKYYDNVVSHALMQVIGSVLEKSFIYESAASIKGRGVDYLVKHVRKFIDLNNDKELYAVQIDFVKCYHNVVRSRLYEKLCRKFNDDGLRYLIYDTIYALGRHNGLVESDGNTGVGLGLYPIQPFVNFNFNDLDRSLANVKGVKPFRYSDNILLIGYSVESVKNAINVIKYHAENDLEQPIHENIGIQKITNKNGILFIGRRFFKEYTKISNETKKKFKIKSKRNKNDNEKWYRVISSYKGILQHINGLHLWQKVTGMKKFSDFNFPKENGGVSVVDGKKFFNAKMVRMDYLLDKSIIVLDIQENCKTKMGEGRTIVMVECNGKKCKFCTNSQSLKSNLSEINKQNGFPFETIIRLDESNDNYKNYYFT